MHPALKAKPTTSSKKMPQEEMYPFTLLTQMPLPQKRLLWLAAQEHN
jgi:hypothetical protein